ncbi:hypothetical protein [Corynebacterium variabile]|uniref:hypothetical protein n=1 Tax=Corynebacterium variabile TaxID=1727 RepID=UPI0035E3F1C1
MDSNRIDGVKVLWLSEGRAARDETAFRHALATAHQLREAGKRMSDAAIIDAYEKTYNVAQSVGADNRAEDMPPMRDRQTMARRVRGYVTSGKTTAGATGGFSTTASVNSRERKALATMGRKGGKKAAQHWSADPTANRDRCTVHSRSSVAASLVRCRLSSQLHRDLRVGGFRQYCPVE